MSDPAAASPSVAVPLVAPSRLLDGSRSALPIEIKTIIYSFCDAPSLAAVCLASFEELALASKLLYVEVVLKTWDQARLLFCDLDESSRSAAVSPFLSLSQIQRVVSRIPNREAWDRSTEEPWHFSLDRLRGGQPLEIQRLKLTPGLYPGTNDDGLTEADGPSLHLAEMFDPCEVCTFQYDDEHAADCVSLGRAWSRLERLVFANAFPSRELCTYGFTERNSVSRRLDVEFRFSQANPASQAILSLDLGWVDLGDESIQPLSLRQNVSVVLRVESPSFAQRLQDCHPGELEGSNFTQSWNAIKWEPY